jgi:hypothetical protein
MAPTDKLSDQDPRPAADRYPWLRRLDLIYQVFAAIVCVYGVYRLALELGWVGSHPDGFTPDAMVIGVLILGSFLTFTTLVAASQGIKLLFEIADGLRPPVQTRGTADEIDAPRG